MKKTPLKKRSKSVHRKTEDLLWIECRRIIKEQYGTDCYTCPAKNLIGSNCQLGHVPWPKASLGAFLKFDLRVLRYQCVRCNLFLGGMSAEAYKRMFKEEGKAYMDKLERDRRMIVKASEFYPKLIAEYKRITL